jgi:hypothetical protein
MCYCLLKTQKDRKKAKISISKKKFKARIHPWLSKPTNLAQIQKENEKKGTTPNTITSDRNWIEQNDQIPCSEQGKAQNQGNVCMQKHRGGIFKKGRKE